MKQSKKPAQVAGDGMETTPRFISSAEGPGVAERSGAGGTTFPQDPQTVVSWLAAADPLQTALLAPGRNPLPYGELCALIEVVARRLQAAGIRRGNRVAVVLSNGPEMAAAFLAVTSVATCAPLNPAYRAAEFEYYLDDLRPKVIIVEAGVETPARDAAQSRGIAILELSKRVDEQAGRFEIDTPAPSGEAQPEWAEPGDVALVLHTSGTTSRPKMVPLTQSNLCRSAVNIRNTLRLEASDRCLNIMPLFHIHGLMGATLASITAGAGIICSPGFLASQFFEWLDQLEPTWYTAVPTMHQAILARASSNPEIIARRSLRFIRSSSAALPPSVMEELERTFNTPVIESYGMTEAAHQMASNPLPPRGRKPGSVGIPAGPEIAVMDEQGAMLPAGTVGDVVIRGPNVFQSYESNPEANASSFINGWFRTGDLGRMDEDGYLFLAGRTKEIINRGGEKISPREVDEILLQHPSVEQALTFALPDARLGEDVAAVVVLRANLAATEFELADFVAERLADFKVPRRIIFLAEIPKGPTGKPQRIGLAARLGLTSPAPASASSAARAERETTVTESWLLEVFREILRASHLSAANLEDDFFDLGGDSILAMQLAARIRARGLHLPPIRVFQLKTAAALAAHLDGLAGMAQDDSPGIPRAPLTEAPVLSYAQERMWFLSTYEEEPASYITPVLYRLTGPLDLQALNHSLSELVARHEVLRTVYSIEGGVLRGTVLPPRPLQVVVRDAGGLSAEERNHRAREAIADQARRGFDLGGEPMLRLFLVRLSEREHLVLLQKHHIATDGWSTSVIWRELSSFYEAFQQGRGPVLGPLPIQYRDFAAWQKQTGQEEPIQRQLDFWVRELSGTVKPLEVPADRPRPARQTFRGARVVQLLPPALTAAVKAVGRQEHCTLFMTLLAAWQALLFRYTGETNFCVGTPVAGRTLLETEPLVGMFVNTLALRADLAGTPTFRQLLARVRQIALDAYSSQDLPLERVIEALRPERILSHSPLFQVMFQLRNYTPALPKLCDVEVEEVEFDPGVALFDLTLEAVEGQDGIACLLNYNRDLFEAGTAERILRGYAILLEAAIQNPDQPVTELPILSRGEVRKMLVEWNQTACTWAGPGCIHQRIEEQAARTPDALAATCGDQSFTYSQLNRRANQMARHLKKTGAGPGTRIGLCMDRSLNLLAGLLGIMKAGAAYVPLDPAYPQAWRQGVVADAGISMVVTGESFLDPSLALEDTANLDPAAGPSDPAYAIYTSGSTGRPKGVEISHRALVNVLESMRREPGFTSEDVLLAVTSISFDIAGAELFLPLIAGGRVWIASQAEAADGERLAKLLAKSSASVMQATPATWRILLESGWQGGSPGLKAWCGGEALPRDLANQLLDRNATLWNLYGPTETTIWSTVSRVLRGEGPVPIGRPVENTEVFVLRDGQPVPVNVPGELFIGGAGVANGYLNRPELTAASFIAPLVPEASSGRWYKTGDLVRCLADGNLVFLGRIDNQVKLRGYRIELGEVESALSEHPSVRAAVAMIRQDVETGGDAKLVAYVLAAEQRPEPGSLHAFLKDRLPPQMVPAVFVVLDVFPVTSNGKIDRKQLPAPEYAPAKADPASDHGWDEKAKRLARIWEEVLDIPQVGLHDNFFALGGHSLLSVRLVSRINAAFNIKLPLAFLFEAPTVAQLAESVRRGSAGKFHSSLVPINPVGSGSALFLVSRFTALGFHALVQQLDPRQRVYGLVPPGPDNGMSPIQNIEDLAAHYLEEIRKVQPAGPYLIGGYSFGGFPAYELACQLAIQGEQPALVFLIDGGAHLLPRYQANLPKSALLKASLMHWVRGVRFHLREMSPLSIQGQLRYLFDLAGNNQRRRRRLITNFDVDQHLPQAVRVVEQANRIAFQAYLPKPYPGKLTQVRSTKGFTGFDVKRQGWAELAVGLEIHEIPNSDHLELLSEPHVTRVAEILRRSIQETGQGPKPPDDASSRTDRLA